MSSIRNRVAVAAVCVAAVAVLAPHPALAQSDDLLSDDSRLELLEQWIAAAPPSDAARASTYGERADLLAQRNGRRFEILALAAEREQADLRRLVTRSTTDVQVIDLKLRKARADLLAIEADLSVLEAEAMGEDLASFGLDFAAFPVQAPTEFVDSWGAARSGGRAHKGTDILGPYGTELLAIEDSVIERISNSALGGLAVYLQGDSGARYFYAHLASMADVGPGDRVHAGQVIALNGDSGNARGTPHLHLQWAPDGGEAWVNPYPMLAAVWAADRQTEPPRR